MKQYETKLERKGERSMKQELRPYLMLHGQFTHHFEHGCLSLCEDRIQGLCRLGHLGCTVFGFTLFSFIAM